MTRSPDSLTLALKLLAKELQSRLHQHPAAHLLNRGRDSVELSIRIPTRRRRDWLATEHDRTSRSLNEGIHRVLVHRSIFHPGHVFCLRCGGVECTHSQPTRPTDVFAGYGPSGVPRFMDLGQWLLDRRDPRVDLLYRRPPALLAHLTDGSELSQDLLPAFRDRDSGYRIHGQVTAGWYTFPSEFDSNESLALTFQVVSTQPPKGSRRFGLNLIGTGPQQRALEELYDLTGELPWLEPTRWAQKILSKIESTDSADPEKRVRGLLNGLATRLERERRGRDRRTTHAQKRHIEKRRPTRKALDDLHNARPDQVLHDTRKDTLVVLGSNGRAHVFNRSARLVTSIRYSPNSIERRRRVGIWKPAMPDEIQALREGARFDER